MGTDETLEREAFEHFKREYLSAAEDSSEDEVYQLMVAHRYGPGARDPMIPVDWDRVFGVGRCPECADTITLGEKSYSCGKCGLRIPLAVYDKAVEEYRRKMAIREEDDVVREKMANVGYDSRRVSMIYEAAVAEALDELKVKRRRQAMPAPQEPDKRAGSNLTGGRDEKK
ncbi:MAG: hypothetical protein V1875_05740 [Candidatus Altiarchaeota archaeon]